MSHQAICTIRAAVPGDSRCMFRWANQPDSLAASLQTRNRISPEEHQRWFAERLSDPNSRIWIIELAGKAVGQIRIQDKGYGPEIAIYVDAGARRQGIAGDALEQALQVAPSLWRNAAVIARVLTDNKRSKRFFLQHGFTLDRESGDHDVYVRTPVTSRD